MLLLQQFQEHEQKYQHLAAQKLELETEIAETNQQFAELQTFNNQMTHTFQQIPKSAHDIFSQTLNELSSRLSLKKAQLIELESTLSELDQKKDKHYEEYTILRQKLLQKTDYVDQKLEYNTTQLRIATDKLAALEQQENLLEKKLLPIKKEKTDILSRVEELKKEIATLQSKQEQTTQTKRILTCTRLKQLNPKTHA